MAAAVKPVVGFKIDEENTKASGALHAATKILSDGTVNPYHIATWGPSNPKLRLHLDGSPNPYFN